VRQVLIPKPGGGERPLGIPTIRDRVVQTAAMLILQPIFEADMEPTAYGYRPGRGAGEAVQEVHRALCAGHTEVVDADVWRETRDGPLGEWTPTRKGGNSGAPPDLSTTALALHSTCCRLTQGRSYEFRAGR